MERFEYNKPVNRTANKFILFADAVKQSYIRRYAKDRKDTMNANKFIKTKLIEAGWTLFDISLIGLAVYIFFIK
jgi:hypothetical protein